MDKSYDQIRWRKDEKDIILARETGFNTYTKIDDSKCKAAINWWENNFDKWRTVREEWTKLIDKNDTINLHRTINDMHLYEYLFSDEYVDKESISKIINQFLKRKKSGQQD